jgi:proteasome assembly chaperone 3
MGLSQDYGMDDILSETNLPYPAQTKQAAGEINGIVTDVTSISFSDRIMVTITQAGRLAQWVSKRSSLWCMLVFSKLTRLLQIHVPLFAENPTQADATPLPSSSEDALLPSTRFTPRSLLGAGSPQREMMGQLYASQIASAITTKNPEETRTLVLGLGLGKEAGVEADRETFLKLIELVLEII